MHSTLFYIPDVIPGTGIPVFGVGLLMGVWAVAAIAWAVWLGRAGRMAELRGGALLVALVGAAIYFSGIMVEPGRGLAIRGYGALVLVAVVSAVALAIYRARLLQLDPEIIYSLAFWLFAGGMIGARLFYVIQYWDREFSQPTWRETLLEVVKFNEGGLVVYGSLIGGVIALAAFCAKYKLPTLAIADLIAPSCALGAGLGRLGCLMQGCCFGGACDLPWAVTFPWGSPPQVHQAIHENADLWGLRLESLPGGGVVVSDVLPDSLAAETGFRAGDTLATISTIPVERREQAIEILIRAGSAGEPIDVALASGEHRRWTPGKFLPRSQPIHPTQIYDAITGLLTAWFLWSYFPFRRRDGEVAALLITVYPITRFLLEGIRIDEPGRLGTDLSISQWISLILFAAAVASWLLLRKTPKQLAFDN